MRSARIQTRINRGQVFILVLLLFGLSASAANLRAQSEQSVAIAASDLMKYDVTAINGQKDQPLIITLTNKGTLPKIAMAHNLVILKPGTDVGAFILAAGKHAADDYIPRELAGEMVAATKLLGPGETDTITFLPAAAGSYPFLCTFPAHALAGMRGVITVR